MTKFKLFSNKPGVLEPIDKQAVLNTIDEEIKKLQGLAQQSFKKNNVVVSLILGGGMYAHYVAQIALLKRVKEKIQKL